MKKPVVLTPTDPVWEFTPVFNAPLVVERDLSALPLFQVLAVAYFYHFLEDHYPDERHTLTWSLGCMLALLGSEWCHNLAHAFIANRINKPIDAIRITFGMPLLVYFDPNDPEVTPREHMLRAIGGPAFNALTLLPLLLLLRGTREDTPANFLARLAFGTNLFLLGASLIPHPSLDGGPLLRWSLIDAGLSGGEAEKIVKRVNGVAAGVCSLFSLSFLSRGKKLVGALLGLLGGSCLAIALGWLDEAY
jgi:Zn-dependent protease